MEKKLAVRIEALIGGGKKLGSGAFSAANQTYYQWLKARDYKLTRLQAADHRQFLAAAVPTERALNSLLDAFGKGSTFEAGTKFSGEELKTLRSARLILERSIIPQTLIRIVANPDDEIIE